VDQTAELYLHSFQHHLFFQWLLQWGSITTVVSGHRNYSFGGMGTLLVFAEQKQQRISGVHCEIFVSKNFHNHHIMYMMWWFLLYFKDMEHKFDGLPVLPTEAVANITRVGNIDVGPEFTEHELNEFKSSLVKMRRFFTGEEIDIYNGFVAKIEAILLARKQLEEEKAQTLH
jgi:hypothetical protein